MRCAESGGRRFSDPLLNALEEQVADLQSDGRAGRGAVPGGSGGDPQGACGSVPDGDGGRRLPQVSRPSTDREQPCAGGRARRRTTSCRSTSRTRRTSGAACGGTSRRARATAQATGADVQTALLSSRAELAVDYFELRGLDAEVALLRATGGGLRAGAAADHKPGTTRASHLVSTSRRRRRSSTRRGCRRPIGMSRARSSSTRSRSWSESRPRTSTISAGADRRPRRRRFPIALPSRARGAAAGHRGSRAASGGGERADRRCAGGILPDAVVDRGRRARRARRWRRCLRCPAGSGRSVRHSSQTVFDGGRRRAVKTRPSPTTTGPSPRTGRAR